MLGCARRAARPGIALDSRAMISLTIDGRRHLFDCPPDTPLLLALREHAGLEATPAGCLIGMCGACTVLLDGRPVRACATPLAAAAGGAVTTAEGVARSEIGRALRTALKGQGGPPPCRQCGPGRLVVAAFLLAQQPPPAPAVVEETLADYACTCARPPDLAAAMLKAAETLAAVRT
jgi:isoquinoline 1-oxidoreductase alpha subunit